MGTEQFAKLMGQSFDQFLAALGPLRKAAEAQTEQALQALGLPSRSQVTAVAKQIVELEERLERLEDRIDAGLRRFHGKEPKKSGKPLLEGGRGDTARTPKTRQTQTQPA